MKFIKNPRKLSELIIVIVIVLIVILSINWILSGDEAENQCTQEICSLESPTEKYLFTKSDAEMLGEDWYPELILNSSVDYSEIKFLMNKYFGDMDIVWKISYGRNLNEDEDLKIMICYGGDSSDVKQRIVSSLNQINDDYDFISVVKVRSKNRFCDPYYSNADNSERYWYPTIGFKNDTTDGEINQLLNNEFGSISAFRIRDSMDTYYMNYYVNLSSDSDKIPEDLNHYIDLSTYGWIFYEKINFNNSQTNYYPVSLNSLSNEAEVLIADSLKNEGIIIYPSRLVIIEDKQFNNSAFENFDQQYENISKSKDVVFIAKSFLRTSKIPN
ncbi:hypothetical protein L1994_11030 [Methanomicrobium antiquum]|uniref:Uncharacterized protein n=1 Tax=Methanomicrobium antiquum TaxID=487686 RepID=A0AAF0FMX5_9EURY|nr:hypothetical protein [Methanomicrobium antiquum]MDD3977440.1 hypothetical protein [Methanomicrobium sp.]WFN36660.1 hypothetical protein L1994_11030 [Methanomicrobium antiquum]